MNFEQSRISEIGWNLHSDEDFGGCPLFWGYGNPMKKLFFILTLIMAGSAHAGPEVICSLLNAKKVIKIASSHSTYDKNRHCTVSCILTLKCPAEEVAMVGVLKEIKDFFGPGEADIKDIEADLMGVALAQTRAANTNTQCLSQCDLYYPSRR